MISQQLQSLSTLTFFISRYDNHREQLLRGAGSSYNDDSLDVYPYFSPSCYKGFGDDAQGFYGVYNEVNIIKALTIAQDYLKPTIDQILMWSFY